MAANQIACSSPQVLNISWLICLHCIFSFCRKNNKFETLYRKSILRQDYSFIRSSLRSQKKAPDQIRSYDFKISIFTRCYLCQPLLCMGWTGETWLRKACRGSCSERFDHLVLKYLKSISERILASVFYSSLNWAMLTVLQKKISKL